MIQLDDPKGTPYAGDIMTKAVREVIEIFEALPEADKLSVVDEILRRATTDNYAALEDDALILAADQVFLELDRREGSD